MKKNKKYLAMCGLDCSIPIDKYLQYIYNVFTMSNTTIINIRTDVRVKSKAQKIADKLGLNLSVLINAYLRQLIRTKTVSFSLTEEPSDYLLQTLKKSKKDIKKGYISPAFDDAKDADEWLDTPKAKYANQIHKRV